MVLCVIKAALKATKNLTLTLSCPPASTHRRTPSSHPNVPFLLAPIPPTPLHQKCPVQWGCPPRKRALELLTLFLLVELILPNLFLSESLANCRSIWQLCCFVPTCIPGQESGFSKLTCNSQRDSYLQSHC